MLYLSLADSRHLYPTNTSTDFRVHFSQELHLREESYVELLEISCVIEGKCNRDSLCIMSDLCGQRSAVFGR